MGSPYFGYTEPQPIEGPRRIPGEGPQWDRAEVSYLCTSQGGSSRQLNYARNDPFPGLLGFIIDGDPETEEVASNAYILRLRGRGVITPRVYSAAISYASSEQISEVTIAGKPFSRYQAAWPQADIMLNSEGFRQVIVGATSLQGKVGQKVGSPQVGNFPAAPPNPWGNIANPKIQVPAGWVLARRDAEPLIDGAFNSAGPWILTLDYVFRWEVVPS